MQIILSHRVGAENRTWGSQEKQLMLWTTEPSLVTPPQKKISFNSYDTEGKEISHMCRWKWKFESLNRFPLLLLQFLYLKWLNCDLQGQEPTVGWGGGGAHLYSKIISKPWVVFSVSATPTMLWGDKCHVPGNGAKAYSLTSLVYAFLLPTPSSCLLERWEILLAWTCAGEHSRREVRVQGRAMSRRCPCTTLLPTLQLWQLLFCSVS